MDVHFQNLQKSNFMRFQTNSEIANNLGPFKKHEKKKRQIDFFSENF